ncbi:hypothetical protein GKZ68_20790 (plasmid) [Hymenobacter sp. BRD128]|uniref:hypothetical protein n=1 Tax=Hymenobacter sp. BRD128 TaxID=2675878 RepID=UPI0015650E75|nr:hypothetical protein [Hymenobacter sp. BRD128]QKG59122.1 hypothetical protein GKZ68_20790 [Hymenobacter sp. BRD128]
MKHIFSAPAADAAAGSAPTLRIDAGWDRILQHFFLTIWQLDAQGNQAEMLYTTLSEPRGGGLQSLDELIEKVEAHQVEAPEGFYERLYLDEAFEESSNAVKFW